MGKKKDGKKKSKGPKGKKARAKAKLQRHWGEQPKEFEEQGTNRRGKSRLLGDENSWRRNKESDPVEEPAKNAGDNEQQDQDSVDVEDSGSESERENGVESFLQKLKSSLSQNTILADDDDEEEQMEVDGELESDEETNSNEEVSMTGIPVVDLFSERFSRPSLPESDEEIAKEMSRVQASESIAESNLRLEEGMDMSLSSEWLKVRNITKQSNYTVWKGHANAAFECNREFLKRQWTQTRQRKGKGLFDSSLQTVTYPIISSYMDFLFTAESRQNRQPLHRAISLHILNHVWTSRNRIHKHNKRIQELEDKEEEVNQNENASETFRDQGFTRPTVLVLLPTRSTCYEFVLGLMQLVGDGSVPKNMDRFEAEYGPLQEEEEEDMDTNVNGDRRRKVLQQKGREWLELFGDDVNNDDDFKLGLTINIQAPRKKTKASTSETEESSCALRLFTDFYKSDVILASPLGLKMACGRKDVEGEDDEGGNDDDRGPSSSDFLSSIEVCSVLRADVLLMQNWDHVNDILKMMNQTPKSSSYTDFSRVRNYMLAGQACHWRQLIISSQFVDPMILSCFKRFATSVSGLARLRRRIVDIEQAEISRVTTTNVRQVFQRIPCRSLMDQGQDRLSYFAKNILPDIRKRKHTLLFCPSYFDFVAVRNLLLKREVDFVSVTEYARTSEVSRGRARFLQGRKPILLYTGRAHYFHRHTIRGARHVIFYGIPEYPEFYTQHVNNLAISGVDEAESDQENANAMVESDVDRTCLALFTKYDTHALERVVGKANCKRMVSSADKLTFLFDT